MHQSWIPLGAALMGAATVLADTPVTCGLDKKCPKETPCCSQYNQCGVGAYCLGGCDPRSSFSLESCVPSPVCRSQNMPMTDTKRIVSVEDYLGDSSKADWVSQGEPIAKDDSVVLTMKPNSPGTILSSTTYMWYGNVKAKLRTGKSAGVVTAFILFSGVRDEIDFEYVGNQPDIVQTNYYFQGIPDYTHTWNITGEDFVSDTNGDFHEYEVQWTPDSVTWLVNGQVGRIFEKKDTWNKTAQQWMFPQTPAQVQISIWPGGSENNPKGTVDWAGGPIDWESDDIKKDGYYWAAVKDVSIECYNATSAPGTHKGKSYTYNSVVGTNNTVVDGNKPTVMKSLTATGLNMNKADTSSGADSVPGMSGSGTSANGQDTGAAFNSGSSDVRPMRLLSGLLVLVASLRIFI